MTYLFRFSFCLPSFSITRSTVANRIGQARKTLATLGIVALLCGFCASAQAKTATSTTLAITTANGAATTVSSGTVFTLTATVNAAGAALTQGQVNFCNGSAASCTDINLLGTAQVTKAGTAILKLRAGIGAYSYKAEFLGTNSYSSSASAASALKVTGTPGPTATTTMVAETGSWGNYSLTATVTEAGRTIAPTGTVSFLDTSNGNSVLATQTLGAAVTGIGWPNPNSINGIYDSTFELAADLNGDGLPDLVMNANPAQVYLANANGGYTEAPVPPIAGLETGPIVIADFNGDGIPDLGVAMYTSDSISILLGKGDGTFLAPVVVNVSPSVGVEVSQIVAADFNGDGIADLLVTDNDDSTIAILLSNGDGTFTPAAAASISGLPSGVVAGDFNADGKTDLAIADYYSNTITIQLGNGDGTFTTAGTINSGTYGTQIAGADFNLDGKLDLVMATGGANGIPESVTVFTGNGDGSFNSSASGTSTDSTNVTWIQVADFNRDGIPDVVLADGNGNATVLLNTGKGSFGGSYPVVTGMGSPYTVTVGVGDLNGDGYSDIMVGGNYGGPFMLYLTEPTETATVSADVTLPAGLHQTDASYAGDSNFTTSTSGTLPLWGMPPATTTSLTLTSGGAVTSSVAPGTVVTLTASVNAGVTPVAAGQVNFCQASGSCTDIRLLGTASLSANGTATLKFVPVPGVNNYKAVFVQNGYGAVSSSAAVTLTVGPAPSPVYSDSTSTTLNGFSGDYSLLATVIGYGGPALPTGKVSFIDTNFGNTTLATATLGPATSSVGFKVVQTPAASKYLVSEVAGDFNGDGILDLAFLGNSSIYDDEDFSINILLGKGDGTFTVGPTSQVPASTFVVYMMAGDFNSDGKTDILLLTSFDLPSPASSTIIPLLGKGDGTFTASTASAVVLPQQNGGDVIEPSIAVADFNGDGKLDLGIVGNYIYGGVSILLGNGDGMFTATATNPEVNRGLGMIAVGDFNGDNIPDLIVSDYFDPSATTVLFGKGDGTFTVAEAPISTDSFAKSAVVSDLNGDGILDLAAGSDGGVSVYLGNGDGTFNQAAGSPLLGAGSQLHIGDFNHDGKLDLAGVASIDPTVTFFLGAGDGTFTVTQGNADSSSPPSFYLTGLVSGDFNQDGFADLSVTVDSENTASIFLTEQSAMATATVNGVAPVGAGTHNVDARYSGDSNYPASVSSTVALITGLDPLTFSPAVGSYSSAQEITITESVPGATIYYSAYGVVNAGLTQYTGPIPLNKNGSETIQAYATKAGYQPSDTAQVTYTLNLQGSNITPTVKVTPSASTITTAQALTVAVSVSAFAPSGNTTPAGSVVLTSGTYSSAATILNAGAATISIPANTLPAGTDTLVATYTPNSTDANIYNGASQSSTVVVTVPIGASKAAVTVTPSATTIINTQVVTIAVSVAGPSGQPEPTGTVSLAVANYTANKALASGTATFTISANTLSAGNNNVTVSYSGDAIYAAASGTASIAVQQMAVSATQPASVAPGGSTSSTINFSASSTYTGTLNLACALTASPSGARSLPTCSINPASVTLASGGKATATLSVTTTAASAIALLHSAGTLRWLGGGGAALAAIFVWGIPARRRRWMSMLAVLLLLSAAGVIGCGGGGQTTPATTAGTYTFTVTGTDSVNSQITASINMTVAVQ
ncbi:beta strand repeat-containing protein [Acidicapsa ligni]|uniref:beta strand repeat-containing protein n=1 Tax=Acidicapsa ligni TaxID=542300 RepID=UPI0021E0A21F|nr:FG-GAP-like repeat-containing protein [Acidicapsa ligni]